MADSNAKKQDDAVEVIIPEETKKKFPDLVEMILGSKSMNNQERNYWLQVLPMMTEPQVAELRDILQNEKQKLDEIEKKYAKKPEKKEFSAEDIAVMEAQKRKEREERKRQEMLAKEEENPDDLLAKLNFA